MFGHEVQQDVHILIRPMRTEDLDRILEIERCSQPRPWTREVFVEEMHRQWAHVDVLRELPAAADALPLVDALDAPVVGFVNFWIVGDEVHILNVATHPSARRRGHGTRLLNHVLAAGRANSCRFVTLEVRRSNRAALRLYRQHGYRPVGLRPHYYDDGEDAIVMILDIE